MPKKRRENGKNRGVKIVLPDGLDAGSEPGGKGKNPPKAVKEKKVDKIADFVAELESRASREKIVFPGELREKLLKLETKGAVKRAWKAFRIDLARK